MDFLADYVRCAAFIFLLSFKPSEPHLTRYLKEVKRLTDEEVNDRVYPVNTYASLVVVALLALTKLAGFLGLGRLRCLSDKLLILVGCAGRVATRLLLLFGDSVSAMQLMQVTFSVGLVAEVVFYAYCLKVVPPGQSQRLTAVVQASYLVAHTAAGVLGDGLLRWTGVGLVGLMWVSALSVAVAAAVACGLPGVDPDTPLEVARPVSVLRAVYSARSFGLSSLWWCVNYAVYMTVYGYESSLYSAHIKGPDNNGTIFAVGLLAGSACALLLSSKPIELAASSRPVPTLVALGAIMAFMTALMGWAPDRELLLGISFAAFFMAWSFANTLFYGETGRVVECAALDPALSRLVDLHDADSQAVFRGALSTRLVSTVFVLNSALGMLVNGLLAAVLFAWLRLDVDVAFGEVAVGQGLASVLVLGLAALASLRGGADGPRRGAGALELRPSADEHR